MEAARILYCHCAYANVVPEKTKTSVLDQLVKAGVEFSAVPDLCEMAARRDPRLAQLAAGGPLRVAACYPRAVRWLFASAGAQIDTGAVEVINMRTDSPETVIHRILDSGDGHKGENG